MPRCVRGHSTAVGAAPTSYSQSPMAPATGDIVVMKFGGTSVAGAEDIRRAAGRIVAAREEGKRVVAVLSARGKTTDELVRMAHEVSERPGAREMDMLLSTGERISCALCAMAIHDLGHNAISLTGSQAGIVTDSSHTKARILDVRADRIREALDDDRIVLVAGFQGVSGDSRDVTTLGRGGSDTTAVAIAAALGAEVCEIYTDVRGVFSADPRLVADARLLPIVSFEEMLEMAASGAGCCSCARSSTPGTTTSASTAAARSRTAPVPSSSPRTGDHGTTLRDRGDPRRGGARDAQPASATSPASPGRIFGALADANVNVDMIIQNEPVSADAQGRPLVHGRRGRPAGATEALGGLEICERLQTDERVGKVSVVGAGMRSHPGVAAKVFETLGENGINIEMIATSPIKISCVIAADDVPHAVQALHEAFDLGADAVRREEPTGAEHRPRVTP